MEHHIHAIVSAPALSAVLTDLKKLTARRWLAPIAGERRGGRLHLLAAGRAQPKTRCQDQVWPEGFHPQAIHDDAMMLPKLESIPHHPVLRGWVASPEHWRWSSAHKDLPGGSQVLRCDPTRTGNTEVLRLILMLGASAHVCSYERRAIRS